VHPPYTSMTRNNGKHRPCFTCAVGSVSGLTSDAPRRLRIAFPPNADLRSLGSGVGFALTRLPLRGQCRNTLSALNTLDQE